MGPIQAKAEGCAGTLDPELGGLWAMSGGLEDSREVVLTNTDVPVASVTTCFGFIVSPEGTLA